MFGCLIPGDSIGLETTQVINERMLGSAKPRR